jgi:hypothetical protein
MPVMNHLETPAIFGRTFLKAVYLAINYETDEFQLAPASYSKESSIQPFAGSSWPTIKNDAFDDTASPLTIGGAVVGGLIGIAIILGLILFCIKKKKEPIRKGPMKLNYEGSSYQQIPPDQSKPLFLNTEVPVAEATIRPQTESSSFGDLGDRSSEALLHTPDDYGNGYYYRSKRESQQFEVSTLFYYDITSSPLKIANKPIPEAITQKSPDYQGPHHHAGHYDSMQEPENRESFDHSIQNKARVENPTIRHVPSSPEHYYSGFHKTDRAAPPMTAKLSPQAILDYPDYYSYYGEEYSGEFDDVPLTSATYVPSQDSATPSLRESSVEIVPRTPPTPKYMLREPPKRKPVEKVTPFFKFPSPVAPFSPYSPYVAEQVTPVLAMPEHMKVHEMPS